MLFRSEVVFKATPGLARMASHLQRIAVVRPENPVMKELPATEQAIMDELILLLIPAREKGSFLLNGFYFPEERKLAKVEMDSIKPLTAVRLGLSKGIQEKDQAEGYRRSLEILTEIEGELTTCEDPDQVLRLLARGGRELLDCDRMAIVVIDEQKGTFEGAVETAHGVETGDLSLLAGREIALSLERGHALYAMEPEDENEDIFERNPQRSFIAVPLVGRKGRLGALVFEKMDRKDFFGEFQRRLAHFLAGQAVSVLESYREGSRLEDAFDKTKALLRISRRIASSLTLEEMCGGLYKEFDTTIGTELLLLSIKSKLSTRRLAWLKGVREETEVYDELLESQGPLMLALSRVGRLVRNNLNTFLRGPGEDELALKGIRSYLAVALQGEDVKGLLLVGNARSAAFTDKEVALIELTAGLISSSIVVPLRHEELQNRIRFLEEMYHNQEEKIQTKTDLINLASHEVRHPLTLIMGFSEVLRDYGETMDMAESREVVGKLNKAADRLRRSVVNMMEISRLESGKITITAEEVDLTVLMQSLVEELRARSVEHEIEVEIDRDAERIYADRDKLEIILFNLLDNAVKYSPSLSKVNVFARRSGRDILVGVKDQGQGISEEFLNSIFQPFQKGEGNEHGPIKGMGLGLYIVNQLVEAHGGRIDVRSEHGRGSTFVAHIPQPEFGEEGHSYNPDALRA